MLDACLMTEDCPGYDRDRRVCQLRPSDCEFAPAAAAEGPPPIDPAPVPDAGGAAARPRHGDGDRG